MICHIENVICTPRGHRVFQVFEHLRDTYKRMSLNLIKYIFFNIISTVQKFRFSNFFNVYKVNILCSPKTVKYYYNIKLCFLF